jgi:hypothetical protein
VSLLLLGLPADLGDVLVPRLRGQGDEVRVLENNDALAQRWRDLGAYVAHGPEDDPDLVMRAATNCRSLVLLGRWSGDDALDVAVEGARLATVERIVLFSEEPIDAALERLRASGLQYVALEFRRKLLRRGLAPNLLAAAVDAADDLAGEVALELDLRADSSWTALGLQPPR